MIDAKTGKLYSWKGVLSVCLPDYDKDFNCNENFSNIEYRRNSKLIIFFGFLFKNGYNEGKRGFHYYKFENGKFIHLKSVLVREQRAPRDMSIDEKANNNEKT